MNGIITSSIAGKYKVLCDKQEYECTAKGAFRNQRIKPLVGDDVIIDENALVIKDILPRRSELIRPNVANIDHLIIVHSYLEPAFSYGLIFKYLTYANMNGIKASVVISKVDKCEKNEDLRGILEVFRSIDVPIYFVNSKQKEGIEEVKGIFSHNIVALIGTSGVGKSTLLNAINPLYNRKEGEYSYSLKGGKHQTKEVVLLPYEDGYLVDTPGFYSLQLNLKKDELAKFYPGMYLKSQDCYYSNCLHLNEKQCAIKMDLESGKLHKVVYQNYLEQLKEIEEEKR
ncbi:MAG: ribosome small subunit-dependent GTPase A [Bacilli bacterium]|nr:ribosome small subunit-dependent GTPase A [Bacilli bacterium]